MSLSGRGHKVRLEDSAPARSGIGTADSSTTGSGIISYDPSSSETGTTDSSRRRIITNDPSTSATAIMGTGHENGRDAAGSTVPGGKLNEYTFDQDKDQDDDTST